MSQAAPRGRDRRPRRPTARRVMAEVLLTAGVVLGLYVVWQQGVGDAIVATQRSAEGAAIAEAWTSPSSSSSPSRGAIASETPAPPSAEATAPPIVPPQPGDGEVFGVVRVPRWGEGFAFPVAGGVSREVTLDPIGIGHYPDTAMPGGTGNFALAGHRTTFGAPFAELASLRIGDAVVVETADGWYTYRFRNLEYVDPTAVEVVLPVPQRADAPADGSYLTMTTCSPRFGDAERLIAYGVFEAFTPRSSGPPTSLAPVAAA